MFYLLYKRSAVVDTAALPRVDVVLSNLVESGRPPGRIF